MSGDLAPHVILLRGAPAVGKSTAAAAVLSLLGRGAVVEVDRFRSAQACCDWHDRRQHAIALEVAEECAAAYVARGLQPVVLVDTFGRDYLPRSQRRLDQAGLSHIAFSLWVEPGELRRRARLRGDHPSDSEMADLINSEVLRTRWPRESVIDTTAIAPADVARLIVHRSGQLAASGRPPTTAQGAPA